MLLAYNVRQIGFQSSDIIFPVSSNSSDKIPCLFSSERPASIPQSTCSLIPDKSNLHMVCGTDYSLLELRALYSARRGGTSVQLERIRK